MNTLKKYNRKHMRFIGHDYSRAGLYFVTICTKNRKYFFGNIKNGEMILNKYGDIVHNYWNNIPNHFTNVKLGEFITMPDHFHGIIQLDTPVSPVGAQFIASYTMQNITSNNQIICDDRTTFNISNILDKKLFPKNQNILKQKQDVANQLDAINRTPTRIVKIGVVVRSFKAGCTHAINKMDNNIGVTIWQRNYYDRIIRSENEYERISNYIINNPKNW